MFTTPCKIITGVTLILKKDNKILLFKRNIPDKIAYGFFALPGGTVERHETVKQAACRKAEEEIGVRIAESDLSVIHMLRLREKYDKATNQTNQHLGRPPSRFSFSSFPTKYFCSSCTDIEYSSCAQAQKQPFLLLLYQLKPKVLKKHHMMFYLLEASNMPKIHLTIACAACSLYTK
jgi:8-oxo-dGTP pyrophosphatase MutT (NUDIX family)